MHTLTQGWQEASKQNMNSSWHRNLPGGHFSSFAAADTPVKVPCNSQSERRVPTELLMPSEAYCALPPEAGNNLVFPPSFDRCGSKDEHPSLYFGTKIDDPGSREMLESNWKLSELYDNGENIPYEPSSTYGKGCPFSYADDVKPQMSFQTTETSHYEQVPSSFSYENSFNLLEPLSSMGNPPKPQFSSNTRQEADTSVMAVIPGIRSTWNELNSFGTYSPSMESNQIQFNCSSSFSSGNSSQLSPPSDVTTSDTLEGNTHLQIWQQHCTDTPEVSFNPQTDATNGMWPTQWGYQGTNADSYYMSEDELQKMQRPYAYPENVLPSFSNLSQEPYRFVDTTSYHDTPSTLSIVKSSKNSNTSIEASSPSASEEDKRSAENEFLVNARLSGMPYKDIRELGGFTHAESTLRGRFRALTKRKKDRVRKPVWTKGDIQLLDEAIVGMIGLEKMNRISTKDDIDHLDISWKAVGQYILTNGGSYRFGNATCKKKWIEIRDNSVSSGRAS